MNSSLLIIHAADAEGKNPHLWLAPSLDEPSVRAFTVITYLLSNM